ncbi:MAG: tetratricopeptide repeat protein [Gammaproteobacteria bacterium]|nr:tetratricopeptide repeat protein [Gammaproteobacteria bacterium]
MTPGISTKLQQALGLHQQGQIARAAVLYQEILRDQPGHFDALHLLGVASLQSGNPEAALELIGRAIHINPRNPDALTNLGNALRELGRHAQALTCYERALAIRPDSPESHYNRALALQELHRHDAALAEYDRALALRPGYIEARYNRGVVLQDSGRHEDAALAFAQLLEIAPDCPYAAGKLRYLRLLCCDWRDYHAEQIQLVEAVAAGRRACDPFSFTAMSNTAAAQLACAKTYATDRYPPAATPLWSGERYAHDKIRVAYLSADFHEHATTHLMAGLFEHHDFDRFEITAISFGPDRQDSMRSRLINAFDHFIDVRAKTDREVALLLREMEIDIAVDLKGYTQGSRTGILAQRPVPVQINYLGMPATMGARYIDYIIADPWVIPPEDYSHYSEQILHLPDSYQATDDSRQIDVHTPARADLNLPEDGFVFGCFNNNYKITPELFAIWMRLLHQVSGSVLWLLEDNPVATRNLRAQALLHGIAPERLVFAPRVPTGAHLARHRRADLFLDTLPYNAHTTASDALWAGLPVLTCAGNTFVGRVAASLLSAVGLPELIARDLDSYAALALELARHPERLREIRARLARNRGTCPLFATDRFRRHLESAYIVLRERSQRGETPTPFSVVPLRDAKASPVDTQSIG